MKHTPFRSRNTRIWWLVFYLLPVVLITSGAQAAVEGYFLAGNLWTESVAEGNIIVPGKVRVRLECSFRRSAFLGTGGDGFATAGDLVDTGLFLKYSDGTTVSSLQFRVVTELSAADVIYAELVNSKQGVEALSHTFSGDGPYFVTIDGVTRSTSLLNRGGNAVKLVAELNPGSMRSAKVTSVPIIYLPRVSGNYFVIPASAFDNTSARFRLADDKEAGGGPSPGGLAVGSVGQVTWNTLEVNTNGFWTVQAVVEQVGPNLVVSNRTAAEFLLQVLPTPSLSAEPAGPEYLAQRGNAFALSLAAAPALPGGNVEIYAAQIPAGATLSSPLPISGKGGAGVTITWTPEETQTGPFAIQVSARSGGVSVDGIYYVNVIYPQAGIFGNTSFGYAVTATGSVTRTFTLKVEGQEDLILKGDPRLVIGGPHAADFSLVSALPDSVTLGKTATFEIAFTPSATGQRLATLSIPSNDPNLVDSPLLIFGNGVAPFEFASTPITYADGKFQFRLNGGTGRKFVVQVSTDLITWTPLQTNTLASPTLDVSDPAAGNIGRRYYRAILVP